MKRIIMRFLLMASIIGVFGQTALAMDGKSRLGMNPKLLKELQDHQQSHRQIQQQRLQQQQPIPSPSNPQNLKPPRLPRPQIKIEAPKETTQAGEQSLSVANSNLNANSNGKPSKLEDPDSSNAPRPSSATATAARSDTNQTLSQPEQFLQFRRFFLSLSSPSTRTNITAPGSKNLLLDASSEMNDGLRRSDFQRRITRNMALSASKEASAKKDTTSANELIKVPLASAGSVSAPAITASPLIKKILDGEIEKQANLLMRACFQMEVDGKVFALSTACRELFKKNKILSNAGVEEFIDVLSKAFRGDNEKLSFLPDLRRAMYNATGTSAYEVNVANQGLLQSLNRSILPVSSACAFIQNRIDECETEQFLEDAGLPFKKIDKEFLLKRQKDCNDGYAALVKQIDSELIGLLVKTNRFKRRARGDLPLTLTQGKLNQTDLAFMANELMVILQDRLIKLVRMRTKTGTAMSLRNIAVGDDLPGQSVQLLHEMLLRGVAMQGNDRQVAQRLIDEDKQTAPHLFGPSTPPKPIAKTLISELLALSTADEKVDNELAKYLVTGQHQQAIHYAHFRKKPYAKALETRVRDAAIKSLSDGSFEKVGNSGFGANGRNFIATCQNGIKMVLKQLDHSDDTADDLGLDPASVNDPLAIEQSIIERFAMRDNYFGESQAYRASLITRFGGVPISGEIRLPDGLYSFQLMVTRAYTGFDIDGGLVGSRVQKSLKAHILDTVILANWDRFINHGNLMRSIDNNASEFLIDNGKAYTPQGIGDFKALLLDSNFLHTLNTASARELAEISTGLKKYLKFLKSKKAAASLHDKKKVSACMAKLATFRIKATLSLIDEAPGLTEQHMKAQRSLYMEKIASLKECVFGVDEEQGPNSPFPDWNSK